MPDDSNQNGGTSGYVGGWGIQGGQGGQTQPTPPPAQQPVYQQPQQPVYQQPYQQQPVVPQYDYGQPSGTVYQQPAYQQPYQQPVYDQPAPMAGMMGSQGGAPMPPPMQGQAVAGQAGAVAGNDPNYKFGEKMNNFTTTIKLSPHNLQFDEAYFVKLLAGSISLSKDEKKRIIDSIPKLRQQQVDELIRIFEDEKVKFIELSGKHSAQLKKLEAEHAADWRDLEVEYASVAKKAEEQNKAEEIRKQLGI